jgi:hypothetical protein
MAFSKNLRLAGLGLATGALAAALGVACSSNDTNPQPPGTVYYVDASNQNDSTTPIPGDETNPGDDNTDDSGSVPDARPDVARGDAQACTLAQAPSLGSQATSCWNCVPVIPSDFLNKCAGTGVTCVPFDNYRLPGYDGGALPALN